MGKIALYGIHKNIQAAIESYFFDNTGISVKSYHKYHPDLRTSPVLIIIEPFRINKIYFTISNIWKRYLAGHFPKNKLIVMGFCEHKSSNYHDLLRLPQNFDYILKNALQVNRDWEIPIEGVDLLSEIKKLFEGHGRQSLLAKLSALRHTLDIAYTNLISKSSSFEDISENLLLSFGKEEWRVFYDLWKHYIPLFDYLPFCPDFQEVDHLLSKIATFFDCKNISKELFLDQKLNLVLDQVNRVLVNIDKVYVRPEIY